MDRLKKDLDSNSIYYSERRFKTDRGVESLGDNPFDFVCCPHDNPFI